ncbi:MAG: transaldolase [Candidatus Omnitrophica bacterium]|nr:transaldolase [Candidatus Omnitrophota bacterium]
MGKTAVPKIKIFADSADLSEMIRLYQQKAVQGFTTNPTLMRRAGVTDYRLFAQAALKAIPDLPISFEVFSDEYEGMQRQARMIAQWGKNVFVKIPITNTKGHSSTALIKDLTKDGLQLNITAILTLKQVEEIAGVLNPKVASIVSVFAGRIADTGVDPVPLMKQAACVLKDNPQAQLLWASSRELLNIIQAEASGCHIITVTAEILKKIPLLGRDLAALSLDTVKQFYTDAHSAGLSLQ